MSADTMFSEFSSIFPPVAMTVQKFSNRAESKAHYCFPSWSAHLADL